MKASSMFYTTDVTTHPKAVPCTGGPCNISLILLEPTALERGLSLLSPLGFLVFSFFLTSSDLIKQENKIMELYMLPILGQTCCISIFRYDFVHQVYEALFKLVGVI